MEDGELRDEIRGLEEKVEELAASLERCQKAILASKISMTIGGLWVLATLIGLLSFDPVAMLIAVAALIGGIVLVGSTIATTKQTLAAMRNAEALRTELINNIGLRVVERAEE
jgi:hypothetical protein